MSKPSTKKSATPKKSNTPAPKAVPKKEPEPEMPEEDVVEDEEVNEEVNEVGDDEEQPPAPPKKRKNRKVVNKESIEEDLDEIIATLNALIKAITEEEKQVNGRTLKGLRNRIQNVRKSLKRAFKTKTPGTGKKVSGFVLPCKISKELADFLQVKEDQTLSRTEVTNAMCVYIRLKPDEDRPHMLRWKHLNPGGKRDLQNPQNKMVIIPDETLSKLLRYDEYVEAVKRGEITKKVKDAETGEIRSEKVTKPDLYYWAAQLLMRSHFEQTLNKKQ